jgi:hypothetical protein
MKVKMTVELEVLEASGGKTGCPNCPFYKVKGCPSELCSVLGNPFAKYLRITEVYKVKEKKQ